MQFKSHGINDVDARIRDETRRKSSATSIVHGRHGLIRCTYVIEAVHQLVTTSCSGWISPGPRAKENRDVEVART